MAFRAFLLLAVVATASSIPASSPQDSNSILNIYGAPRSFHPMGEVEDDAGMYNKPFFAATKVQGKNEVVAFLLKDGLSSLSSVQQMDSPLRDLLTKPYTATNRIGIVLSAARYLQLPEIKMPIVKMVPPLNFTLDDVYAISQGNPLLPWMYLANKEDLPAGVLDKLIQVGQFAVSNDKLQAGANDKLPVANEPLPTSSSGFLQPPPVQPVSVPQMGVASAPGVPLGLEPAIAAPAPPMPMPLGS